MRFGSSKNTDDHSCLIKTFKAQGIIFAYEKVNESPSNYERIQEGVSGSSAAVMKTSYEMEGPYLDFIIKSHINKPFILTGPLIPEPPSELVLDAIWDAWLARFSEKSVVFCSLGSETL